MSLKSKANVPQDAVETVTNEQVSFDDLEFEAEYVGEEELTKSETYLTISGKECQYEPSWEKYSIQDFDIGDVLDGTPEINIFENDDKTYNAMRLRLLNDGEIVDLYFNYPKKEYPYVKNINKYFDFYRPCFDFIYSVLRWRDETNVVDSNGEEIDRFNKVNIENFAKFVDGMSHVKVKITEGNPDSDYNSWIILDMG